MGGESLSTITMKVDREKFVDHVRRICCKNIRVPAKICLACPFREQVLEVMREKNWKLPKGEE